MGSVADVAAVRPLTSDDRFTRLFDGGFEAVVVCRRGRLALGAGRT